MSGKLLTPEQWKEIQTRHEDSTKAATNENGWMEPYAKQMHQDREALLSHIEILQAKLIFADEVIQGDRSESLDTLIKRSRE